MLNILRTRAVALPLLATGLLIKMAPAQQLAGVSNFHTVNPHLFRGAQPSTEGFQELAKLGIKTVVDLREAGDRSLEEKKIVEGNGMHYVGVPMRGFQTPSTGQIDKVMSIFNDDSAAPVFVHCRRGADRTGTVVACYRIAHDRWANKRALDEARSLGMSRFQLALRKYVLQYTPDRTVAASVASSGAGAPSPALVLTPAN
jgi:tyrosine-protein phosphatase SIW14